MEQQITDAEIEERTHLLELVKISTEVFSRQQYERLKELSNKMFASAGSPHIAKENTKHMAQTAVEFLEKQLTLALGDEVKDLRGLFVVAKEMEKQQIVSAYKADRYPCSYDDAEQYYNETYKTQAHDKQQS